MARKKRQSKLRPRKPARVKKKQPRRPARAHHHPELGGLGLAALGLFLATLLYLGWEGGVVGEAVADAARDAVGAAAFVAPAALVALGALMLARSALVDVRPFRTGLAVTAPGLLLTMGDAHGGAVGALLEDGLAHLLGRTG